MANRRNSIKKIRRDKRKQDVNRASQSELKTIAKKFAVLCDAKKYDEAKSSIQTLFSKIDRAVKRGVLKENNANRKKSRASSRLRLIQT